ncbi:MAG: membrane protein insertion efficiency factor YidD [Actinomycetota bacterium]
MSEQVARGAASRFAVRFVQTYRARVGPGLEARCRFEPSCSTYALETYGKLGFVRATAKTLRRLTHCRAGYRGDRIDPP